VAIFLQASLKVILPKEVQIALPTPVDGNVKHFCTLSGDRDCKGVEFSSSSNG